MRCFLHSTHLTLGLVLEAEPVKTPIVCFGGESIAGNCWTEVQHIDHGDTQKYVDAEKAMRKKEIKKTHYCQLGQIFRIQGLHYIGVTDIVMNDKILLLSLTRLTLYAGEIHSKIIHYDQNHNRLHMLTQWWIQVPEDLYDQCANHYYWHSSLSQKKQKNDLFVLIGEAIHNQSVKSSGQPQVPWDKSATQ